MTGCSEGGLGYRVHSTLEGGPFKLRLGGGFHRETKLPQPSHRTRKAGPPGPQGSLFQFGNLCYSHKIIFHATAIWRAAGCPDDPNVIRAPGRRRMSILVRLNGILRDGRTAILHRKCEANEDSIT